MLPTNVPTFYWPHLLRAPPTSVHQYMTMTASAPLLVPLICGLLSDPAKH